MSSSRLIQYRITADTQGARRALLSAQRASRLVAYRIARADGHSAVRALRMATRRIELKPSQPKRSATLQEVADSWNVLGCPPIDDPMTARLILAHLTLHSIKPRPLNRFMAEIDLAVEGINVAVPEYAPC